MDVTSNTLRDLLSVHVPIVAVIGELMTFVRSMLARRAVTRPATFRSQLQRRFIHPSTSTTSTSQLHALPRPNTWLAKIRFRADGRPRSKEIALRLGEYPF
jgi:hypothetical protein